jgi:hypothetical protein
MISSIISKSRKLSLLALALAMVLFAVPKTAYASSSTSTVPSTGTTSKNVTATFTIDDEIMQQLGYGAVISVPVNIPLSYSEFFKKFVGSAEIVCSGVIDEGKSVVVSIDTSSASYGRISDSGSNTYSVKGKDGFAINLTKDSWTSAEMLTNYNILNNEDTTDDGTTLSSLLSVNIPGNGFIPKVTGDFTTTVPLVIGIE